jgi:glutamine phosphoribosylpyrophosphate amidotransferase
MCEILAMRSEVPFRLGQMLAIAERLDAWGDTGYGWGIAWLDLETRQVRVYKQPVSLLADPRPYAAVGDRSAHVAFLHLRSPSDPTTVGLPDTQPFLNRTGFAFAHNGYLPAHNELRPRFAGRYAGRADSEIGSLLFEDLLGETDPAAALREVHRRMGGDRANLIALFPDGRLFAYASHVGNLLCSLRDDDREVLVTSMHQTAPDVPLVQRLFPGAQDLRVLPFGEIVTWAAVAEPAVAARR